jgi:P-type Cu+ transporter
VRVHDEVCGMTIDSETAAASVEFEDHTYYFCTDRCRRMFVDHPDRYVPVRDQGEPPVGGDG